ncbi:MAG: hypothetical protein WCW26_02875 [Candidatus Buchananbacteria bacterium]
MVTKSKNLIYHLFLAFGLALVWTWFSNGQYLYNHHFPIFLGLNLFPLIGWTIGFLVLYSIYSLVIFQFGLKSFGAKLLFICFLYWPTVIVIETIGYYWFDIHNLGAASYPGLPVCNCLHAPVWMQIGYFVLGPIYLILCELLRLEKKN